MTGQEYRQLHGSPDKWTDLEYEQFAQCAAPGDPAPARALLARLDAERKQTDHAPAA